LDRRRHPRRRGPGHVLPRRPAEAHLMSTPESAVTPAEERAWPGLDVSGLRILVAGFGISGYAVADQTMQRGAHVLVVDGADTPELRERAQILEVLGVEVRLGAEHLDGLPQDRPLDLVVTSPGWRPEQPLLRAAQEAGVPVWSEIELARRMQAADGPAWLAVTGTNGKTTTVTMLESILLRAGLRAVACGNVGLPVIEAALDPEGFDVLALELSSFQLHWTQHLDCEAAAALNVSDDHLDWHGGEGHHLRAGAHRPHLQRRRSHPAPTGRGGGRPRGCTRHRHRPEHPGALRARRDRRDPGRPGLPRRAAHLRRRARHPRGPRAP